MIIPDLEYFYFDLDRNIWDTTDKYGNPVWARQLIFPLDQVSEDSFIDDCLTKITLQEGIKDYLQFLSRNNKKIGFLSRGANLNTVFDAQPSFKMMQLFDIAKYFNAEHILLHKNQKKYQNLHKNKFVYFDDSYEEINIMQTQKKESFCVLRSDFFCWRDLF